eukprot:XP_011670923.1 PREDICTED: pre-mRNA-splicing factor 38B [Strongylocentrotus purpuratus]
MPPKNNNTLPLWGNQVSMNLNPLILTNIQSSPYFKNDLFKLKTYHEVIDEIYYKVAHLEPWERGSRQTSGQIGMCGGVRGVGAGGIVSSAYCLLYKLYTLKLTRKQLNGLLTHSDSSYIRALGFLYIRYSQPPQDLWDWYEEYLNDEEEVDTKAGGGNCIPIGQMLMHFLVKLEWHSSLFPRIPVPVMKDIERKVSEWQYAQRQNNPQGEAMEEEGNPQVDTNDWTDENDKKPERFEEERKPSRDRDVDNHRRDRDRHRDQDRDRDRDRGSSRDSHRDKSRHNSRDHSRDRDRHRGDRSRDVDFDTALRKERDRQSRDHGHGSSRDGRHRRSRSRSHERKKRSRSREKRRKSRSRSRDRHRRRSRDRR